MKVDSDEGVRLSLDTAQINYKNSYHRGYINQKLYFFNNRFIKCSAFLSETQMARFLPSIETTERYVLVFLIRTGTGARPQCRLDRAQSVFYLGRPMTYEPRTYRLGGSLTLPKNNRFSLIK